MSFDAHGIEVVSVCGITCRETSARLVRWRSDVRYIRHVIQEIDSDRHQAISHGGHGQSIVYGVVLRNGHGCGQVTCYAQVCNGCCCI